MQKLFVEVLNLSIVSAWLILVVLCLRALIKKIAPRWTICLLWGLVAICLIVPFSFESTFSLVPSRKTIVLVDKEEAEQSPENDSSVFEESDTSDKPQTGDVHINSGFLALDNKLNAVIESHLNNEKLADKTESQGLSGAMILRMASYVWLAGVVAIIGYFIINYVILKAKLKDAFEYKDGVFLSERIDSPFLFGFIKPGIYLPVNTSDEAESYVLAHEQAHIKRLDYLTKPFGFVLLAIHWFNPLVWIAYTMLGRDIEYACDEKVIKDYNAEERKAYATALLECGVKAVGITCPVAFGEISVKSRILKTLNYKKPMLWVVMFIVFATAVLALCFLSSPKQLLIVNDEATEDEEADTNTQVESSVAGVWYTNGHSLMFEDGGDGVCHSEGVLVPFKWETENNTISLLLADEHKGAVELPTKTEFALSEEKGILTIGNTVYTNTYKSKLPANIDSALVGTWYSYSGYTGCSTMVFNADGSGSMGGLAVSVFTWSVKDGTIYLEQTYEGVSYTIKYKDYKIEDDILTLKSSGIKKRYSKKKLELGGNAQLLGTWNPVTDSEEKMSLCLEANGQGDHNYSFFLWSENDGTISFYCSDALETTAYDFDIVTAEYTVNGDKLSLKHEGKVYNFVLEPNSRPRDVNKADPKHPLGGDSSVVGDWSVTLADTSVEHGVEIKADMTLDDNGTGEFVFYGVKIDVNWYTDEISNGLAIYFPSGDITEDIFYGEYSVKGNTLYVNDESGSVICFTKTNSNAVSHLFNLERCDTFTDFLAITDKEVYIESTESLIILRTTTDITDLKITSDGETVAEFDEIGTKKPFGMGIATEEGATQKRIFFKDINGNEISFKVDCYTDANGIITYLIEELTIR